MNVCRRHTRKYSWASSWQVCPRTIANLADRDRAREAFVMVLLMCKYGLRAGEVLHSTAGWLLPEDYKIVIPSYISRSYSYCVRLAEQRAQNTEDLTVNKALEAYWSLKTESGA